MPKFRKKPVVIEASQLGDGLINDINLAKWCGGELGFLNTAPIPPVPYITIHTLEGDMRANVGDWIIQGVNGDFYPCKPDIFDKTYESVEAD